MQYPKSVAETWLITFEQLSAEERELLNVLAWLDPAPIPVWLVGKVEGASSPLSSDGSKGQEAPSALEARELLAGLHDWHLITWSDDGHTFKVHRLVQEVTRLRLRDEAECKRTLSEALSWLDEADIGNPQDPFTWSRWIPVTPHVLQLAAHSIIEQLWIYAISWQTNVAGLHLNRGQYRDALPLFRGALDLAESHLSPLDGLLSSVLNNLASLLSDLGKDTEAEPLYRRALDIDIQIMGSDHPKVALRLNNLAEVLRKVGRYIEAESLYRQSLVINEISLGLDHPEVARVLNNLALLCYANDRRTEAEPMYRRAAEIYETFYGPKHTTVATVLNNLAQLLSVSNRSAEAEPLFRRALTIDERSLGLEHPNLARDLMNLASVLHGLGRSQEALPLIQRAVDIYQRSGETHGYVNPELANAQAWLKRIQKALD